MDWNWTIIVWVESKIQVEHFIGTEQQAEDRAQMLAKDEVDWAIAKGHLPIAFQVTRA